MGVRIGLGSGKVVGILDRGAVCYRLSDSRTGVLRLLFTVLYGIDSLRRMRMVHESEHSIGALAQ
ncbi:hypothetical protein KS4_09720 [Poriferisphaera corsica]|uniref:Uncharacterized protein n=1 Tax=Poriferisphaera corsica TaxID=2528020 RepID=A0A517YRT7_9BACT|nr:hypothetical protein KS4_09720 [Poriferisphaera corsica]